MPAALSRRPQELRRGRCSRNSQLQLRVSPPGWDGPQPAAGTPPLPEVRHSGTARSANSFSSACQSGAPVTRSAFNRRRARMCVAGCHEVVMRSLSRRGFFKGAAGAGAATFLASALPEPATAQAASFSRVIDLTHTLSPEFPTFGTERQVWVEPLLTLEKNGYNMHKWTIIEHVGTHMDAPIHFSKDG